MDNGIMVEGKTALSTSFPSFLGERITASFRLIYVKVGIVIEIIFFLNTLLKLNLD